MTKTVKFQFEDLDYQQDAVSSIVKLFSNVQKSMDNSVYAGTINAIRKTMQGNDIKRRNVEISKGKTLRDNLRKIQSDNGLILNDELETDSDTLNFTVEMETGERVIIVMGAVFMIKSRVSGTLTKYISCIA
ncbi:hypothetical protein [Clostridium algidicarnis]|uniref:hypothetical protein n=1 Tax=Clostridium algidicarnis TaxID=37659 RepID=UPI00209B06DB|nr:hypothetical protein [Clostridium algidicarnis]